MKLNLVKNYKIYDRYKDSGVEWLGEIPDNWNVLKLKYLTTKIIGGGTPATTVEDYWSDDKKKGYPWVSIKDITTSEFIIDTYKYITEKGLINSNAVLVSPYKILYSIYASLGKVAISDKWLTTNQAILAIYENKKKINYKYLIWFLKFTEKPINNFATLNTQNNINLETLKNLSVSLPSKQTQQKIADYLDEKTEIIDKIIKRKKKLIELLEEKKTSLIDKEIKKYDKESKEIKLKYLIKGKLMYGANEPAMFDDYKLPRYIRITDFSSDRSLRSDTFKSLPQDKANEYLLEDGDILFARSGATVGKTFQFKDYEGKACFAGYLIKASPNKNKILSDYLYYFTKSRIYRNWKNSIFIQATIQNIGADKYEGLKIPVMDISYQQQIIDYLDKKTEDIDKTIKKINQSINLLTEYKFSLISHVVTGKVKIV